MDIFSKLKDSLNSGFSVVIGAERIQSELAKKFPTVLQEKGATIILDQPTVDFYPDENRLGLKVYATVDSPDLGQGEGWVTVSGSLRLDKSSNQLYLQNVTIQRFDIQGLSKDSYNTVRQYTEDELKRLTDGKPIYNLNKHEAVANRIKDIKVGEDKLQVVLGL